MRGYVITGQEVNMFDDIIEPIGIVSSRKAAIQACEDYLSGTAPGAKITWRKQEKHTGYATKLDTVKGPCRAWYKMFIINNISSEE